MDAKEKAQQDQGERKNNLPMAGNNDQDGNRDMPTAIVPRADEIRGMAQTAEQVADDLAERFPETAEYLRGAAIGARKVVETLQDPGVNRLLHSFGDFARRQPVLVIVGAATLGLVLWGMFSMPTVTQGQGQRQS